MTFLKKDPEPINAGEVLDELDQARDGPQGRGRAELSARARPPIPGAKITAIAGAAVAAGFLGYFTFAAFAGDKPKEAEGGQKPARIKKVTNLNPGFRPEGADAALPPGETVVAEGEVPEFTGDDDGPAIRPVTSDGGAQVPALERRSGYSQASAEPAPSSERMTVRPLTPAERQAILRARRLQGDLGPTSAPRLGAAQPAQVAQAEDAGGQGELGQALKPLRLKAQAAGKLTNRNYLLTQGAMIDCVLQTRLVSTVPGMTSCYVTRDIYSANGRVVLIDRGSKVVGNYQGGVKQGQPRLFVQWTRVETPKGVIINLDSPGTGPLGEGGLSGVLDNHFRERFGGAILLSMIDDLGDYFANRRGSDFAFGNSQDAGQEMAKVALENSINIPPTLYKNQGERISIFVARDLDFSGVYSVARR